MRVIARFGILAARAAQVSTSVLQEATQQASYSLLPISAMSYNATIRRFRGNDRHPYKDQDAWLAR
jgi:hypothetical protein